MKRWLLLLIVLVVIGAGITGTVVYRRRAAATAAAAPEITAVKRGDIQVTVEATAEVTANREVEIKAKASGEIIKLPFEESDLVRKGDLLAELDPIDEIRSVQKAEITTSSTLAKLEQAKTNLDVARRALVTDQRRAQASLKSAESATAESDGKARRTRELFARELVSREELEAAEAGLALAAAAEEGARARLQELETAGVELAVKKQAVVLAAGDYETAKISLLDARQRLTETKIYAPEDGVISALNVQRGQIVSSAISNVGGGSALAVISDLSRLFVLASVDESDVGGVAVGQRVLITADAFPREDFEGIVSRVAVNGVNTSNVVKFEIKIEVTSPNKAKLKPLMTTNVTIITEQHKDVLMLPTEAVVGLGGEGTVTREGAAGQTVKVATGATDGTNIEVVSGLKEGDRVVLGKGTSSKWQSRRSAFQPPPPPGM